MAGRRRTGVALMFAAAASALLTACSGPGVSATRLSGEAVLVAPVPATELGRTVQNHEAGFIMPGTTSAVIVAYQVDLTPEQALKAWRTSYGEAYGLSVYGPALLGSDADANVEVEASETVASHADSAAFQPSDPGATVVTVTVSGRD